MTRKISIDARTVQQMAQLSGLDLATDRAEALIPALQWILAADVRIADLHLETVPAVGADPHPQPLPRNSGEGSSFAPSPGVGRGGGK